jgi:hypothetical protein
LPRLPARDFLAEGIREVASVVNENRRLSARAKNGRAAEVRWQAEAKLTDEHSAKPSRPQSLHDDEPESKGRSELGAAADLKGSIAAEMLRPGCLL